MAEVFLARPINVDHSKLVAVKKIHNHLVLDDSLKDQQFIEMFYRESQIALKFRNPNIIMVHEYGAINNIPYIAMEFFPGKTLRQLMKHLRDKQISFQIEDILKIIHDIASALDYIHNFSDYGEPIEIIHRDISPQNIMIGYNGDTKLIDFGISKQNTLGELTKTNLIKGKISYMSPEQVSGKPLNKQTDIFSLGIVMWELLSNKKLFTGENLTEVMEKVSTCNVPWVKNNKESIPDEIAKICHKALKMDLKSRYSSFEEMIYDIEHAQTNLKLSIGQKQNLAQLMCRCFIVDMGKLTKLYQKYEMVSYEDNENSNNNFDKQSDQFSETNNASVIKRISFPALFFVFCIIFILSLNLYFNISPKSTSLDQIIQSFSELIAPQKQIDIIVTEQPSLESLDKIETTPNNKLENLNETKNDKIVNQKNEVPTEKKVEAKGTITPIQKSNSNAQKLIQKKKQPGRVQIKNVQSPFKKKKSIAKKISNKKIIPQKTRTISSIEPSAYITVFAENEMKIQINKKEIGSTLVKNYKIPANKDIELTIVDDKGIILKSHSVNLKANTKNIIDMTQ